MKNRPSRLLAQPRISCWLTRVMLALAAGCSSNPPPDVFDGAPADTPLAEPMAAGAGNAEDPDATETNFITFVCESDAECRGEERCIFPSVADAGAGSDAGVVLGRCKVPGAP
jgi:hypothetical protein